MRIATLSLVAAALFGGSVSAQTWEVEDCEPCQNAKAVKLVKKAQDKKKYKYQERQAFLEEAIELDDACPDAHYEYAVLLQRIASQKGGSVGPAISEYKRTIEACEGFHSEPYYHVGMRYMELGKWAEAAEYLDKYYRFSSPNEDKFSRKYEKQSAEAKRALKYARFMHENLTNPKQFDPVLVANVSSEKDEYLPLISPDNEKLFFTRKSEKVEEVRDAVFARENPLFEERFSVAEGKSSKFNAGLPLPPPFNQDENLNYGGATVSLDNRHLYLTVCEPGLNGYVNCDIYYSHLTYGIPPYMDVHEEQWYWTELENCGPNINTEDGWEAQPSLSADGKTLYFATARADSRMIDIYSAEQDMDGNWLQAEPLPEVINTSRNDKSPFMHSDSETLYFASEGHMGFGGFDVYFTRKNAEGEWLEPQNIGYPINSDKDEHGFVVSTDGTKVYFGSDKLSDRGKGGLDIFTFELYKGARPKQVAFVKGHVGDEEGRPINNAQIELKTTNSKRTATFDVDSLDGTYAAVITLEQEDDVVLNVKAEDKAFSSQLFTAEELGTAQEEPIADAADSEGTPEQTPEREDAPDRMESETSPLLMPPKAPGKILEASIELQSVEVGKAYTLSDIHYTTNSAEIDEASRFILDEFIAYLEDNSNIKVAIHGHTDDRGNKDDNMALSADRAFSVMQYLQEHGIEGSRLKFQGFGPTKPIASNSTDEGRATNRRTEFVITDM